jgi:hypothetical protein
LRLDSEEPQAILSGMGEMSDQFAGFVEDRDFTALPGDAQHPDPSVSGTEDPGPLGKLDDIPIPSVQVAYNHGGPSG